MKYVFLVFVLLILLLHPAQINANAYIAGCEAGIGCSTGYPQYFPPEWHVRIFFDSCGGVCTISILLPNGTMDYVVKDYDGNAAGCTGNNDLDCFVDYLTPDLEGLYQLNMCSGYQGCIPGGYPWQNAFYVKKMPALESLSLQNQQLQQQLSQNTNDISLLQQAVSIIKQSVNNLIQKVNDIMCYLELGPCVESNKIERIN